MELIDIGHKLDTIFDNNDDSFIPDTTTAEKRYKFIIYLCKTGKENYNEI